MKNNNLEHRLGCECEACSFDDEEIDSEESILEGMLGVSEFE